MFWGERHLKIRVMSKQATVDNNPAGIPWINNQVTDLQTCWFGQPKHSTFLKKVILRCIGLCFNYHQN